MEGVATEVESSRKPTHRASVVTAWVIPTDLAISATMGEVAP